MDDEDADPSSALAPDELDVTDDDHVEVIDEHRYVVSPNETIGETGTENGGDDTGKRSGGDRARDTYERGGDRGGLQDAVTRHGFDVVGKFDDRFERHHHRTDDVVVAFESLLLWIARQVDEDTPTAEVLGILLLESDVTVRYPAVSLQAFLEAHDLEPDDSIADLQSAVRDGFEFPPADATRDL